MKLCFKSTNGPGALPFNSPPSIDCLAYWDMFVLSYGPSHLSRRRKNKSQDAVSQFKVIIFKNIMLSAENHIICLLLPESNFPVAYPTEDIFYKKLFFRRTNVSLAWVTRAHIHPWLCGTWVMASTHLLPSNCPPERRGWTLATERCRPSSVHTRGEGVIWKIKVRKYCDWGQNGGRCQRQEASGS